MAIDYGKRRCGIAVTDPCRIIANGLLTVQTPRLTDFLRDYLAKEQVDKIIIGRPLNMDGADSDSCRYILPAVEKLKTDFPCMEIEFADERFTSVLAHRAMIDGGMKKSDRREKGRVDAISAAIILNDYLQFTSKHNEERIERREERREK